MVGNQHARTAAGGGAARLRQIALILRGEAARSVGGEAIAPIRSRRIRRIAIDKVARPGLREQSAKISPDERRVTQCGREVPQFLAWKVRARVAAERHVELAPAVVAAEAVVAVAIQVDEEAGASERVAARVEFRTPFGVGRRVIRRWNELPRAGDDEPTRMAADNLKQADDVGVGIADYFRGDVEIERDRAAAGERLD